MVLPGGLADHYGVLELPRGADELSIKKHYRKLVLQWHPDKQPGQRELADRKIREINQAYETLGNPQRRLQYDQQLQAFERHAQGVRLDTSGIQPRMSIPREFMLCPMGNPDKFVRSVGNSLLIQSREDVPNEPHADFFKEAKFSLWWCAQRNNMCHIRAQSTAGQGVRGGLHVSFKLQDKEPGPVSDTVLTLLEEPQTFFVVVASPAYQGAFRFEAAFYPGHYLVFEPPTHWRLVSSIEEGKTILDFMLVDYGTMFKYVTLEEALVPVVQKLGGDRAFVDIEAIRRDPGVARYFQTTLNKVWTREDFETYFSGHYQHWVYDPAGGRVRIRSKLEALQQGLRDAASSPGQVAALVAGAGPELSSITLAEAMQAMTVLETPLPEGTSITDCVNQKAARKRILGALCVVVQKMAVGVLLQVQLRVAAFCRPKENLSEPDELQASRQELYVSMGHVLSDYFRANRWQVETLAMDQVLSILSLPLDWTTCAVQVSQCLSTRSQEFAGTPSILLIPLLRHLLGLKGTEPVRNILADALQRQLPGAPPMAALEAMQVLAECGGQIQAAVLPVLKELLARAPPGGVGAGAVSLLAHLAEQRGGAASTDEAEGLLLKDCAVLLGASLSNLKATPPSDLLRLSVAAAKCSVIAQPLFEPLAKVTTETLQTWTLDDLSKLLLAYSKSKGLVNDGVLDALYRKASAVLRPQLSQLSATQLLKVLIALGKVPFASSSSSSSSGGGASAGAGAEERSETSQTGCAELFEATCAEAVSRLTTLPPPQQLLVTQSVLPLGRGHKLIRSLEQTWISLCETTPLASGNGKDGGGLSADQASTLLRHFLALEPSKELLELLAKRLFPQAKAVGEAGRTALAAALSERQGREGEAFLGLEALLEVCKDPSAEVADPFKTKEKKAKRKGDSLSKSPSRSKRKASRSRSKNRRSRDRDRRSGHDRRSRSRGNRDRDRERDRGGAREDRRRDSRDRGRGRDRNRRADSRDRDRDRDRRR